MTGFSPGRKRQTPRHRPSAQAIGSRWGGAWPQNTGSDRNVLQMEVLPDVELGPVRQRKPGYSRARLAGVIQPPQFRSWRLGSSCDWPRGNEETLLGAAFFPRRAGTPKATFKSMRSSACFSPSVFQRVMWSEPC